MGYNVYVNRVDRRIKRKKNPNDIQNLIYEELGLRIVSILSVKNAGDWADEELDKWKMEQIQKEHTLYQEAEKKLEPYKEEYERVHSLNV